MFKYIYVFPRKWTHMCPSHLGNCFFRKKECFFHLYVIFASPLLRVHFFVAAFSTLEMKQACIPVSHRERRHKASVQSATERSGLPNSTMQDTSLSSRSPHQPRNFRSSPLSHIRRRVKVVSITKG